MIMKKLSNIVFLLILLFNASIFNAQNNSLKLNRDSILTLIDSLKDISPSIELSTEFNNKVTFWGRSFDRNQYGFENDIIYKTTSGLYATYTGYIWSAMPNRYAKTDLGIGYQNQFTDKLYCSIEYQRWFFNNGDDYARNALANFMSADINYDLNFISIQPTFYYMFGYENIFQTDLQINHEFQLTKISKAGKLLINPQFLSTFTNKSFLPIYGNIQQGDTINNKFRCVDLELSLPLKLSINNFDIESNVHYNYPIKINNEAIKPFFYLSIRLAYNIYFSKN